MKGSRLALVPLVISIGVFISWFLYYATDWWGNPGTAGALGALLGVALGWVALFATLWRVRRTAELNRS
ncbi:MAG: hypothetical protein ACR2MA_08075 [Egibacteraceae bacterium]